MAKGKSIADRRLEDLRKRVRGSESTPMSVSTSHDAPTPEAEHTHTSTRTPRDAYTPTADDTTGSTRTSSRTPPYTSHDTPQDVYASTPAQVATPTPTPTPTPREHMVRTQIYLRPDQIRWLDKMVTRMGGGVTRSDWIRYAIDEAMRNDVDA